MVLTSYVNYGLKTTSFVDSYKFKNQHPGRCHIWLSTKWVHRPECWFDGYARINKWRHSKLEKQQMVRRDIWTTSTNLPINKMGQPHILLFLAPYHFSCCPENTKWVAPTVSLYPKLLIHVQRRLVKKCWKGSAGFQYRGRQREREREMGDSKILLCSLFYWLYTRFTPLVRLVGCHHAWNIL